MSVARGLERRLERFVDGIAARMFGGRFHPVELGNRLLREADLAVSEGPAGPVAPNRYLISAALEEPDAASLADLANELARLIEDTAAEHGWRLEGPASVSFAPYEPDGRSLTIEAAVEPGERPAWATLLGTDDRSRHAIRYNRILIGRSTDCDVVLTDRPVSRFHAILWREGDRYWLGDLGSANGTLINGHRVVEAMETYPADVLSFADTEYLFRPT